MSFGAHVLAASIFLLTGLVACSGGGEGNGGGGAGGSGAGGQATGGAGACPKKYPTSGAPCDDSLSCDYDTSPMGCDPAVSIPVPVACVNGAWTWPADWHWPGSCSPLAAPCDPVGTWPIHVDWGANAQFHEDALNDFDITIGTNPDGYVYALGGPDTPFKVLFTVGWCSLAMEWVIGGEEGPQPGYSWTLEQKLELTFAGDTATGTLTRSCWGECDGEDVVSISATRAAP